MANLIRTKAYVDWVEGLKDRKGRAQILARVDRLEETGHPGDAKAIGDGVIEMRIHFGPGYRVYYVVLRRTVVLLGGNKSSQVKDIKTAKLFAGYWKGQEL
jgi:putative addiction module killer protein